MKKCIFYFDVISPYAYFAFKQLERIPASIEVELKPVLFAGLLGHWESKGPAEIPPKRIFTYQFASWYAKSHSIPFRCPPVHPFNPLPGLRLAIAAGASREVVDKIFSYVWADGREFTDENAFRQLVIDVGLGSNESRLNDTDVKQSLRENTELAIEQGVFGVPSYVVDGQLFWGVDALPMLLDFIDNPAMMNEPEMRRATTLPIGVARKL
ncbi:MAG: DsbA family protein [Gammaproteobacteria bacterium]